MSEKEPKPVELKKPTGKTKTMIITVGISSTGKTEWAKSFALKSYVDSDGRDKWTVIDRNNIRFQHLLFGKGHGWKDYKATVKKEKAVSQQALSLFSRASIAGENIIISDNNLSRESRERWHKLGVAHGYLIEYKYFGTTLEEAYEWDLHRGDNAVGRDVLNLQWQKYLIAKGHPLYVPNIKLKSKVVLVDLETALMNKDGSMRFAMCQMLSSFIGKFDVSIIYFSSGYENERDEKFKFLSDSKLFDSKTDILITRLNNYYYKSYHTWKMERFWGLVSNNHVLAVMDGHQKSVNAWYDIGIKEVINTQDSRCGYV